MNCKKGDLAIIVKSWAGNEGKIVRCLHLDAVRSRYENVAPGGFCYPPEPIWIIDRQIYGWDGSMSDYIADSQLRPIRDPGDDAVDEMLLLRIPSPSEPVT